MASQPKNIIIVGGSLAGLMSGLVLKRSGHHVRIFERSPSTLLQSQGAGITFGIEGQEFLSKHVLVNREFFVNIYLRQTLGRDGVPVDQEKRRQKMTSWDLLYFVLRACFDGMESVYCAVPERKEGEGEAGYEYGRKVVGVKEEGAGVKVEFEDVEGKKDSAVADMVIAADGPSSTIRRLLMPDVERRYVGYVAFRGTVPESEASKLLKDTFTHNFTFYHGPGIQILSYLIPGPNGSVEPGSRLINWVWYCNYHEDSKEYKELMTDIDGHHHRFTMPVGKIQPHLWTKQKQYASDILPTVFSELVNATKHPFVQSITDVLSYKVSFLNDKVLLVGDAVAGFRPHTAASTRQAAYDALLLDQRMKGEISHDEMAEEMLDFAKRISASGVWMGARSQFESLKDQGEDDKWYRKIAT